MAQPKIDIETYVNNLVENLVQARQSLEVEWKDNFAALYGHQWSKFSRINDRYLNYALLEPDRIRLTFNKLDTIMAARATFVMGGRPIIEVGSTSPETIDKQRALTAQRVIRAYWDAEKMGNNLEATWEWTKSTGNAYAQIYYDAKDGDYVGTSNGKRLFKGKVKYRPRSSFEVYIDPMARSYDEARYVICLTVLSIEEAESRLGEKIKDSDTTGGAPPFVSSSWLEQAYQLTNPELLSTTQRTDQKGRTRNILMTEYWEKPSDDYPDGRYVVNINNKLKREDELECGVIPIVHFTDKIKAGVVNGETPVTDMRPVQENYNRMASLILERAQMADLLSLPRNSGFPRNVKQFAGKSLVIGYHDNFSGEAKWVQGGQMRQDHLMLLRTYEEQMENMAAVSSIATRSRPPYQMSGRMGYIVTEANRVILEPISNRYATSVEETARLLLRYIQKFYTEERTAVYINEYDRREIFRFKGVDIGTNYTITIKLTRGGAEDSGQSSFKALQAAQNPIVASKIVGNDMLFKRWIQSVNPDWAHELFVAEQDTAVAEDENFDFKLGNTPEVKPYQNDDVHIREHTRQLNSDEIKEWREDCIANLEKHLEIHEAQKESKVRRNLWLMQSFQKQAQGSQQQPGTVGSPGIAPAPTGLQGLDQALEQKTQESMIPQGGI